MKVYFKLILASLYITFSAFAMDAEKQTTVHPAIKTFLQTEIGKSSSLSPEQIASLEFHLLSANKNKIDDMRQCYGVEISGTGLKFIPIIEVPDIEELFKRETINGTITFTEIPDNDLSPNLKTKKTVFKGLLKHEEGHFYHKHSRIVALTSSVKMGAAIMAGIADLFLKAAEKADKLVEAEKMVEQNQKITIKHQ